MPLWRFDLPQAKVNFVDENYFKSPKIEIPAGTLTNKIHFFLSCLQELRNCRVGAGKQQRAASPGQPAAAALRTSTRAVNRGGAGMRIGKLEAGNRGALFFRWNESTMEARANVGLKARNAKEKQRSC